MGGSPQSKHLIEDLIIESSKFPAAQPPDPNQPAKIETDYWPCPPSLAVVGRTLCWRGEREAWDTASRELLLKLHEPTLSPRPPHVLHGPLSPSPFPVFQWLLVCVALLVSLSFTFLSFGHSADIYQKSASQAL